MSIAEDVERLRERLKADAQKPPQPFTVLMSPQMYRWVQEHGGIDTVIKSAVSRALAGEGEK